MHFIETIHNFMFEKQIKSYQKAKNLLKSIFLDQKNRKKQKEKPTETS